MMVTMCLSALAKLVNLSIWSGEKKKDCSTKELIMIGDKKTESLRGRTEAESRAEHRSTLGQE